MSQKPREFWIDNRETFQGTFKVGKNALSYEPIEAGFIHVREVLPPEPSLEIEVEMKKLADEQWNFLQADRDKWKSLCEKLVHEFRNGTISSINMAISEYEKECK